MLLILSAKYVNEDIALHYGHLPPSFLPLGAQRLFTLQAEQASAEPVFMTVPDDFSISPVDEAALKSAGISLISQPSNLSLTNALKDALERIDYAGPLRVLYGDTLVRVPATSKTDFSHDRIMVQTTTSNYPWAYVLEGEGHLTLSNTPPDQIDTRRVVCGDFIFTDLNLLKQACAEKTIIDALNTYHSKRPFKFTDADEWMDFGHLPLYFQSKKSIMIKRVFNSLSYEDHQLIKLSDDTTKIRAEANWYENIPVGLQYHTPRYSGRVARIGRAGYAVEYLYHPLLSDLWVFGALPLPSWLEILEASFELLDKCHALVPSPDAPEMTVGYAEDFFSKMIVGKTWERLENYCETNDLSLDSAFTINGETLPPLGELVKDVISRISPTRQDHIKFWHGDMFFGNMFYDFTARRVLVIDPRGQLGVGQTSLYGDFRYDLAKLAHSIIGQYDNIILGRTELLEHSAFDLELVLDTTSEQTKIEDVFRQQVTKKYDIDLNELIAMTSLLFFSMLPLHKDRPDLQRQMLANGLRLSLPSQKETS